MKRIAFIVTALVLIFVSTSVIAQPKYKFGHIDSQKILALMPERAEAEKTMQTQAKNLQTQLETMKAEYDAKVKEFYEKKDSLSELILQTKQQEIADIEERIQTFRTKASEDLQKKESDLMKPIYEKFQKAISDVSKEQKFTYIFDINTVLFYSDDSIDIADLVRAKLKITK